MSSPRRLFELECARIQLIICSLFGYQLIMAAALDYSAVVEHHNDIRILDGRETVRDNEHRSALHQLIHTALNDSLGTCIYRGGRLVEYHYRRVGDRRAGDGYQLALSLREIRTIRCEHGIIALRQTGDKVVRTRQSGGGAAFPVGRVELSGSDIVHHRARDH